MIFDNLNNCEKYFGLNKNFEKAFDFLKNATPDLEDKKYELDGKELYAIVSSYNTKALEDGRLEAHRNYIDIQYIISGTETMEAVDISKVCPKSDGYNPEKDVEFFENLEKTSKCVVEAGEYGIFFPNDVHKPNLAYNGNSTAVKKIVVKVKL